LVIGATSAIAEATARRFALEGAALFLLGRRIERLKQMADDLQLRGAARVGWQRLDVNETERHEPVMAEALMSLGGIDIAIIAHGTLPDQAACQTSAALAIAEFHTNAVATIALLTRLAMIFEEQRHGRIAVITSVAGDRGRESNYLYGAAKAAVDTFLEGLRQRLHKSGVGVTTIRPGFVDTPMTAAYKKGLLWAQPETVARHIHRALLRGRDIIYVPPFWRGIMLVIRLLPQPLFKRLRL
jgi:short-subunit dehydrogenase